MIDEAKGRELSLPGPAGYESCIVIIRNTTKHWKEPAHACIESVHALMEDWFLKSSDVFEDAVPSKYPRLQNEMAKIIINKLKYYKAECTAMVSAVWMMESDNAFTTNNHYLATNRRKYRSIVDQTLSGSDLKSKLTALDVSSRDQLEVILNGSGIPIDKLHMVPKCSTFDDEVRLEYSAIFSLIVLDSMLTPGFFHLVHDGEQAIDTIAGSLAYIRVAVKRFQDQVPLNIMHFMIDLFANTIEDVLKRELGVFTKSPDELHFYFQEDPNTEYERLTLEKKKAR